MDSLSPLHVSSGAWVLSGRSAAHKDRPLKTRVIIAYFSSYLVLSRKL
jgi:hypothetical protein